MLIRTIYLDNIELFQKIPLLTNEDTFAGNRRYLHLPLKIPSLDDTE